MLFVKNNDIKIKHSLVSSGQRKNTTHLASLLKFLYSLIFFLFGDKQRRGVFLPPYLYQCLEPSEPEPIWEQMKRGLGD